jgi:triosephosphate isomerase
MVECGKIFKFKLIKGAEMRKPIVAGNWKMHKTVSEAEELVKILKSDIEKIVSVESVFCVPFTALSKVSSLLSESRIGVGVQNIHWEKQGAYTGEISPPMVKEFANYAIIGHSERRAYFGETDEYVNKRVIAALENNIVPIVCVGETLDENKQGITSEVIERQISVGLKNIPQELAERIVVAYEPVWAIGTGLACNPSKANEIILESIRKPLAKIFGEEISNKIRVQYGGSVNGSNAQEYFSESEIDGALVGGASLKPDFIEIVKAAAL